MSYLLAYIPNDETDGHDAEEAQQQFAADLHAKRHAAVLDEVDSKPVEYDDLLAQPHVELDGHFDALVNGNEQNAHCHSYPCVSFHAFNDLCSSVSTAR